MFITSQNNLVACLPFSKKAVEAVDRKKLAVVSQYTTLAPLTVVMDTAEDSLIKLKTGDTVYVKGTAAVQAWAKDIYNTDVIANGFILVPVSEIVAVSK